MRAAIGLWACVALAACSGTEPSGTGSATGSGGTPGSVSGDACDLDLNDVPAPATPISFKDDVMPIFGISCSLSACHNSGSGAMKAGLYLGPRCDFDTNAKWQCTFPTAVDPKAMAGASEPITQQLIDAAYASITGNAMTVTGAAVPRVKPGDPAGSFLMDKLADKHNTAGFTCQVTDPRVADPSKPCGDSMPPGDTPLCRQSADKGTGARKFTAIAQWIAAGAPKN